MTIHLPAETALALAMALTDTRYDLRAKRTAAEQAIEDLINFLDDTEGDTDLEPNGDERDASYPESWLHGHNCENEDDEESDESEDGDPLEPHLGRPDLLFAQDQPLNGWTSHDDCEVTNEDGDPLDDGEWVNEDGGNITDEPHDAEEDCCAVDEMSGSYGGMGYEAKKAIDHQVRQMLARVGAGPKVAPSFMISGPDGTMYRVGIV
jgi:hypothetical protein